MKEKLNMGKWEHNPATIGTLQNFLSLPISLSPACVDGVLVQHHGNNFRYYFKDFFI